jgi:hypothetical protein
MRFLGFAVGMTHYFNVIPSRPAARDLIAAIWSSSQEKMRFLGFAVGMTHSFNVIPP